MNTRYLLGTLVLSAASVVVSAAEAQPVGTFRWQLQPYCNVVTVAITQNGGVYRLEGTDDQCGTGGESASVIGTAFPNPSGSIGFGLNIVSTPGGAPGHIEATFTLPATSGTWRDSVGHSGAFVFTPGAGTGGSPRPTAAPAVTIGATGIDPAQVQLRISGSCTAGLFMQSIGQNGSVGCAAAAGGGGSTIPAAFSLLADGSFVARGTVNTGAIPISGNGTRMMWAPRASAFRAGTVTGTQWDAANIGGYSSAMGLNTTASGDASVALGDSTTASASVSTAMGLSTTASGGRSTAMGRSTTASGIAATAMGELTTASGVTSTAMGYATNASGRVSTAIGHSTTASADSSTAMGANTRATAFASTAVGWESIASGSYSTAMGFRSTASGTSSTATGILTVAAGLGSTVMGTYAEATSAAPGSFVYGDRSTVGSAAMIRSTAPNEFIVRAAGGVGFYTSTSPVIGVELSQNGSGWLNVSDVNVKTNFRDLAGDDVLAKIAAMPIREWNYVTQAASIRHVGPTAQDFRAAFGLGESPRHINTIDADGIALAGVKALDTRTRATNDALAQQCEVLTRELADLRARLARLETLLDKR